MELTYKATIRCDWCFDATAGGRSCSAAGGIEAPLPYPAVNPDQLGAECQAQFIGEGWRIMADGTCYCPAHAAESLRSDPS